jgi:uncharacterized protein (TIGR00255 family)
MTAFAQCSDQGTWGMATWEIKVVNHRYFDCSIKIPEMFHTLDPTIRLQLQKMLHRGRIDCSLRFIPEDNDVKFILNKVLVKKLINVVAELKNYLPKATIDPMKILSWPNVLQSVERDLTAAKEAILCLFVKTIEEVINMRNREGSILTKLLQNKMQGALDIITEIKEKIPDTLINQRHKLNKRLEEITVNLDQSRLEQEMVYFSQKVDITEEIDRLFAHIHEALKTLNNNDLIGKRLDFLMQESNREANTLASKSINIIITRAAIELKMIIEQIREQVQNIV